MTNTEPLFPQQPKLPLPTTCPYGHSEFRDTPVLCGMLAMTPELRRRIDNREVILGGCVITPGSHANYLICTTCQYQYDPYAGEWQRTDRDAKTFRRPLSRLLLELPSQTGTARCNVEYSQVLAMDHLKAESADWHTRETLEHLDQRINKYFLDRGMTKSFRADGLAFVDETGHIASRGVHIMITRDLETEPTRISVKFTEAYQPRISTAGSTEKKK